MQKTIKKIKQGILNKARSKLSSLMENVRILTNKDTTWEIRFQVGNKIAIELWMTYNKFKFYNKVISRIVDCLF